MFENARLNSIKDVMTKTNLSRSTIYGEMGSGRLRSVKVGRRRLVPESALIDYINGLIEAGAAGGDDISTADESGENIGAAMNAVAGDPMTVTTGAVLAGTGGGSDRVDPARAGRLCHATVMPR
ncbi:MAG: helix-turn-helix domain-containing protein [Mycobacterium sp.]|nr:helix-turn-helix domain-containing protein [Mycobacterium sp.]